MPVRGSRGSWSCGGVSSSIRKRLGPVQLIAGVDFKKTAAVETLCHTAAAADNGESVGGCRAETRAAIPCSGGAVRRVEVVIACVELSGDQLGAFFCRNMPSAF